MCVERERETPPGFIYRSHSLVELYLHIHLLREFRKVVIRNGLKIILT